MKYSKIFILVTAIILVGLVIYLYQSLQQDKNQFQNVNLRDTNSIKETITSATQSKKLKSPSNQSAERAPSSKSDTESPPLQGIQIMTSKAAQEYVQTKINDKNVTFNEELSLARSSSLLKVFQFNQFFQGYEVFDSSYILFTNSTSGEIVSEKLSLKEIHQLPQAPSLTLDQAIKHFSDEQTNLNDRFSAIQKNLLIFSTGEDAKFIWMIHHEVPGQISSKETILLDANSLKVLFRYPTAEQ